MTQFQEASHVSIGYRLGFQLAKPRTHLDGQALASFLRDREHALAQDNEAMTHRFVQDESEAVTVLVAVIVLDLAHEKANVMQECPRSIRSHILRQTVALLGQILLARLRCGGQELRRTVCQHVFQRTDADVPKVRAHELNRIALLLAGRQVLLPRHLTGVVDEAFSQLVHRREFSRDDIDELIELVLPVELVRAYLTVDFTVENILIISSRKLEDQVELRVITYTCNELSRSRMNRGFLLREVTGHTVIRDRSQGTLYMSIFIQVQLGSYKLPRSLGIVI